MRLGRGSQLPFILGSCGMVAVGATSVSGTRAHGSSLLVSGIGNVASSRSFREKKASIDFSVADGHSRIGRGSRACVSQNVGMSRGILFSLRLRCEAIGRRRYAWTGKAVTSTVSRYLIACREWTRMSFSVAQSKYEASAFCPALARGPPLFVLAHSYT
jgi:hypothetical protein